MKRRSKDVHLQGVKDARAVCGFDWMAAHPRIEAVPWTRRDRATCKRCLELAAAAIAALPDAGESS